MYADRTACLRCLSKWYRNNRGSTWTAVTTRLVSNFRGPQCKRRRRVRCVVVGPHETTRARSSRPGMRGDDRILRAVKHACYDCRKIWDGRDFLLGHRFETPPSPGTRVQCCWTFESQVGPPCLIKKKNKNHYQKLHKMFRHR